MITPHPRKKKDVHVTRKAIFFPFIFTIYNNQKMPSLMTLKVTLNMSTNISRLSEDMVLLDPFMIILYS